MTNTLQKNFIIGDKWLYYKIYTGIKTTEHILLEMVKPVAERLMEEKIIDKWFFIRYTDPKHHLRLRFHCTDTNNLNSVITALAPYLQKFIEQHYIWKIQNETYEREIERYGKNSMDLSEKIFHHDSEMILNILDLIDEGEEGDELRWLFSLRGIDAFLESFRFTIGEKENFMDRLKTAFEKEYGSSKFLKRQLDTKYRNHREKIEAFMTQSDEELDHAPLLALLNRKQENIAATVQEIQILRENNNLNINIDDFLSSHIHMFMNRLFKSKNRTYELVCYFFLHKYYKSSLARLK